MRFSIFWRTTLFHSELLVTTLPPFVPRDARPRVLSLLRRQVFPESAVPCTLPSSNMPGRYFRQATASTTMRAQLQVEPRHVHPPILSSMRQGAYLSRPGFFCLCCLWSRVVFAGGGCGCCCG